MKSRQILGGIGFLVSIYVHAMAATLYVDLNSTNPVLPYANWSTAATNIQDAVDASTNGDLVLVTNGAYATAGRTAPDGVLSSVVVTNAISIQGVNGAAATLINGNGAMRCVYLSNVTDFAGFTLTNGNAGQTGSGGGLMCASTNETISECVFANNGAFERGGGAYSGTLTDCLLYGNSTAVDGGGASHAMLVRCTLVGNSSSYGELDYGSGGGASSSLLVDCSLTNNLASSEGGGASFSTLIGCVVSGNSAGTAGGAIDDGYASNCTFIANTTAGNGGASAYDTIDNCVIISNSATGSGGGAYRGTLHNCVVVDNFASKGGACAFYSALNNCTVVGNTASSSGGGIDSSSANNSVLYFNSAPIDSNYSENSTLNYSCSVPLPANGTNNITSDPELADLFHISSGSPCRFTGSSNYVSGMDIDGEPWANPPAIGCDEYYSDAITGVLSVAIEPAFTNVVPGFSAGFIANISGHAAASSWDFGDGTVISNEPFIAHSWSATGDYPVTLTAYNDSIPLGVSTTLVVHVLPPVRYVDADNILNAQRPYETWASAAANIQDAIDASGAGGLVLVTNGVYNTGGRVAYGALTNRVAVVIPLTLRSVNGPAATAIQGYQILGATNGNSAIRAVYLTNGVVLDGFTISGGATRTSGDMVRERSGGGIWCESTNVMITNCILMNNLANSSGGGAYSGTFLDCVIESNSIATSYPVIDACGGGTYNSALYGCTLAYNRVVNAIDYGYGGGACDGILSNCVLVCNSAYSGTEVSYGGGACSNILNNCTLISNSVSCGSTSGVVSSGGGAAFSVLVGCGLVDNIASTNGLTFVSGGSGGGAYSSTLGNCRLIGNSADFGGGADSSVLTNCIVTLNVAASYGGGISGGTLINCTVVSNVQSGTYSQNSGGGGIAGSSAANCIVYFNSSAVSRPNYVSFYPNYMSLMTNCCTFPLPTNGLNNFTNDPAFVDAATGDLHLQSNSPCINAGNNNYVTSTVDFDGHARIVGVAVDMGAYEYQGPTSILPFVWLLEYGLPTDGSIDYADLDGSGMNVYQDWIAGLNPTNALSVLKMLPPVYTNYPSSSLIVSWESVSNRTYFLQRSLNLGRPFSTIATGIPGQSGITSFRDSSAFGNRPFFYRVGVQQ